MIDDRELHPEAPNPIATAAAGVGPLFQRDYWGVIRDARHRASEIMTIVAKNFWHFSPRETASFERCDGTEKILEVGDEMNVKIAMAGTFQVRVVHRDANSLTIRTIHGHPEAGRITFGCYPNSRGDIVIHIRSRARSGSALNYVGFLAMGDAMQTNTWTDFIDRVAATVGAGIIDVIHADKRRVEDESEDIDDSASPTFLAQGD